MLSIYEKINTTTTLIEVPVYAAGRVATFKPPVNNYFYEVNDTLAMCGPNIFATLHWVWRNTTPAQVIQQAHKSSVHTPTIKRMTWRSPTDNSTI